MNHGLMHRRLTCVVTWMVACVTAPALLRAQQPVEAPAAMEDSTPEPVAEETTPEPTEAELEAGQ
ncbi:MAG: hypothetical protein AAF658_06505, partial [Myxococcota bacterium]